MPVSAEAIKEIVGLAKTEILEVNGRTYQTKSLHPVADPTPESLYLRTLTGIVDYVRENPDNLDMASLFIHVESFSKVSVLGPLLPQFCQRKQYVTAEAPVCQFAFGTFLDREEFMIAIQAFFAPTPDRENMLKVVGNILQEATRDTLDDGVTQRTIAKCGIGGGRREEIDLPNPVTLTPYVSFCEIEQPEIKYVFRIKDTQGDVRCALFDADGSQWKLDTALKIQSYLHDELEGCKIII